MPMKKGTLGNNNYIFEPILILTTLSCFAFCPLVECKSSEWSDKASRIYSGYNISECWKSNQFSYKIPIKKVRAKITPTFLKRFWFWQRCHVVQYVLLSNAKVQKGPKKNQESKIDKTWAILENPINSHGKGL